MAVTRTIKGTLDRLQVSAGSEITYVGPTAAGNVGDLTRGFRVNPAATGDIIVTIDKSSALNDIEIFREDSYAALCSHRLLQIFQYCQSGQRERRCSCDRY